MMHAGKQNPDPDHPDYVLSLHMDGIDREDLIVERVKKRRKLQDVTKKSSYS